MPIFPLDQHRIPVCDPIIRTPMTALFLAVMAFRTVDYSLTIAPGEVVYEQLGKLYVMQGGLPAVQPELD
jgi:hypothetical protein